MQNASSLPSSGRPLGLPLPLAELLIVVTGFFATVSVDGAMEITERVFLQGYTVAGALQRMQEELRLEQLTRGYIAAEPVQTARASWSDVPRVGQSRTRLSQGSRGLADGSR